MRAGRVLRQIVRARFDAKDDPREVLVERVG